MFAGVVGARGIRVHIVDPVRVHVRVHMHVHGDGHVAVDFVSPHAVRAQRTGRRQLVRVLLDGVRGRAAGDRTVHPFRDSRPLEVDGTRRQTVQRAHRTVHYTHRVRHVPGARPPERPGVRHRGADAVPDVPGDKVRGPPGPDRADGPRVRPDHGRRHGVRADRHGQHGQLHRPARTRARVLQLVPIQPERVQPRRVHFRRRREFGVRHGVRVDRRRLHQVLRPIENVLTARRRPSVRPTLVRPSKIQIET